MYESELSDRISKKGVAGDGMNWASALLYRFRQVATDICSCRTSQRACLFMLSNPMSVNERNLVIVALLGHDCCYRALSYSDLTFQWYFKDNGTIFRRFQSRPATQTHLLSNACNNTQPLRFSLLFPTELADSLLTSLEHGQ